MSREWESLYNSRSVIVTLSSLCRYFSPDRSVVPLTRFARESVYSSSLTSSQVFPSCLGRFERLTPALLSPALFLVRAPFDSPDEKGRMPSVAVRDRTSLSVYCRRSLVLSDFSRQYTGGAVMTGMAFCTTWQGLAVCRVLLGLFESGFFPSCVFLITTWYKRGEVAKRLSVFVNYSIQFPLNLD